MSEVILFATTQVHQPNYFAHKSYGVHRISTELRNCGLSTQVVHYFSEYTEEELIEIADNLCDENTKIIGFSTLWWVEFTEEILSRTMNKARFFVNYAKSKNSNIKVVAGGPSGRIFLREENSDIIDMLFEGFSEQKIINYVNGVNQQPDSNINGVEIYNAAPLHKDFVTSKITYEPNDLISSIDTPVIEMARGCIFKCKFCAFPHIGKRPLESVKTIDTIREELTDNYYKYGITNYMFADETFNDSTKKLKLLHEIITSLPFKIHFSAFLRLDLLNAHPEQIQLLKEMGLVATFFGVESFHPKAAKLIGKGSVGGKAKELLKKLKTELWGPKIKIGIGLIVGIPYETYESYNETLEWILDPENPCDVISAYPLTVYKPDDIVQAPFVSEFQRNADKYGFYWEKDENGYRDWKNSIGPVKSWKEAFDLYEKFYGAIKSTNRHKHGGFNILKALPLANFYDNSIKLDDLLTMDRHEFVELTDKMFSKPEIETEYIENYKKQLFALWNNSI